MTPSLKVLDVELPDFQTDFLPLVMLPAVPRAVNTRAHPPLTPPGTGAPWSHARLTGWTARPPSCSGGAALLAALVPTSHRPAAKTFSFYPGSSLVLLAGPSLPEVREGASLPVSLCDFKSCLPWTLQTG